MTDMHEKRPLLSPPHGLSRWLFRLPIWLYRLGLGWLLGGRFLLLNHIGRKSGLPRQTVLEVVKYDKVSDTYYVAVGFGPETDWYRNLLQTPQASIQVKHRQLAVTADPLSAEQSGEAMVDYARRHPTAARNLSRLRGYNMQQGTEEDYRRVGRELVQFVALRPLTEAKP
jgi:deazaflavin-dependent oxidoreductase (nitroreductase family)